jgi:hypothetical protein
MFDDDAIFDPADPVGRALRALAMAVSEEATTSDPTEPSQHTLEISRLQRLCKTVRGAVCAAVGWPGRQARS